MGGELNRLTGLVRTPGGNLQAAATRAVQQYQDAQILSVQNAAARRINDYEKAQIRGFTASAVGVEGVRGVNARFEIWKRTYNTTTKKNEQSPTPIISQALDAPGANYHEQRFLVTQMSMPSRERFSIMRTFGTDQNFFMTFGQEPRIWNIAGILPRSGPGNSARDWYRHFTQFYNERLRADLMVQRSEFAVFIVGRLLLEGYVVSFDTNVDSQMDDVSVPFTMSFFVRSARFLDDIGERGTDDFVTLRDTRGPGTQWRLDLPQETSASPEELAGPAAPPRDPAFQIGTPGFPPPDPDTPTRVTPRASTVSAPFEGLPRLRLPRPRILDNPPPRLP